jgi:hypothetical protein
MLYNRNRVIFFAACTAELLLKVMITSPQRLRKVQGESGEDRWIIVIKKHLAKLR